jgi:hypothetical protein
MPTPESPVTTSKVPRPASAAEEHRFERHSLLSREDESPASGRAAVKGRSGTASPEQRRREVAELLARGVRRHLEAPPGAQE